MTATVDRPAMDAPASEPYMRPTKVRRPDDLPEPAPLRVLIVDDDRALREGCVSILQSDGYGVVAEGRGDSALDLVRRRHFDVVLLNLFTSPVSGMDVLRTIREVSRETLVIIMTSEPSVQSNVEALDAGAWEYVPKPFSATHLRVLMGRAAHTIAQRNAREEDRSSHGMLGNGSANGEILGVSEVFQRVLNLARKVASTDASVMLVGESGTGKEMLARFIHANSRRAKHTMMPVNCAALPEALLESEMFGHRRGAFTGADRDKPGLLETAHQGTMFLDELTEMSHPIQAKLLRVLQDGRLRRVGSEEEDRAVDVRLITATNQDPEQAVRAGILRQDLFFRLWVFPIRLPPLRERPEDVIHLSSHFLSTYWTRHRSARAKPPVLGEEVLSELARMPWPGNVRELQNTMERLAVTAEPGQVITPGDLPAGNEMAAAPNQPADELGARALLSEPFHTAKDHFVADFEKTYLTHLAQRAGRNLSRAARLASIDRTTLYRLLERHGLHRSNFVDTEA